MIALALVCVGFVVAWIANVIQKPVANPFVYICTFILMLIPLGFAAGFGVGARWLSRGEQRGATLGAGLSLVPLVVFGALVVKALTEHIGEAGWGTAAVETIVPGVFTGAAGGFLYHLSRRMPVHVAAAPPAATGKLVDDDGELTAAGKYALVPVVSEACRLAGEVVQQNVTADEAARRLYAQAGGEKAVLRAGVEQLSKQESDNPAATRIMRLGAQLLRQSLA